MVADNKCRANVLDRPRRREAAFGHVTTPREWGKELFAFVGQHTLDSVIDDVEGYQRRYPRCEPAGKMKTDPIGGSQWNTWGGNFENFIRPQTRRRAGTLYSESNVEEPRVMQ
jgi:hypothetical protein